MVALILLASTSSAQAYSLRGLSTKSTYKGFYDWGWKSETYAGPTGTNVFVAFGGHAKITDALAKDNALTDTVEDKWLTIGGGTDAGKITVAKLNLITEAECKKVVTAGYAGIMFDIEKTGDSGTKINTALNSAIKNCRAEGLDIGITTSHNAPYDTPSTDGQDAKDMVEDWCKARNDSEKIDVISPQLYTSGTETEPEYGTTSSCTVSGCDWSMYKDCGAKIAPSIVDSDQYSKVQTWATEKGLDVDGWFQWKQE